MWNEVVTISDLVLILVLIICLYTDVKYRMIYNKVVLPAILFGMLYNIWTGGWQGGLFALQGLAAGVGLLLIPFVMGGFGAGDVKLLGAIGALKGPGFVFKAFIFTGLSGGIVALAFLIYQRKFLITLKRVVTSIYILFGSRFKVNTLGNLEKVEYHEAFPYGIAIVAGTMVSFLVR